MKKKNITQFQTKLKKREDMKRQSHDVTLPEDFGKIDNPYLIGYADGFKAHEFISESREQKALRTRSERLTTLAFIGGIIIGAMITGWFLGV